MYFFLAHYINMDTDTETTKKIEFDGQFFSASPPDDRAAWT